MCVYVIFLKIPYLWYYNCFVLQSIEIATLDVSRMSLFYPFFKNEIVFILCKKKKSHSFTHLSANLFLRILKVSSCLYCLFSLCFYFLGEVGGGLNGPWRERAQPVSAFMDISYICIHKYTLTHKRKHDAVKRRSPAETKSYMTNPAQKLEPGVKKNSSTDWRKKTKQNKQTYKSKQL